MPMAGKSEHTKCGRGNGEAPGVENAARCELLACCRDGKSGVRQYFLQRRAQNLHGWERKSPEQAAHDQHSDGQSGACRGLGGGLRNQLRAGHGAGMVMTVTGPAQPRTEMSTGWRQNRRKNWTRR